MRFGNSSQKTWGHDDYLEVSGYLGYVDSNQGEKTSISELDVPKS